MCNISASPRPAKSNELVAAECSNINTSSQVIPLSGYLVLGALNPNMKRDMILKTKTHHWQLLPKKKHPHVFEDKGIGHLHASGEEQGK